MISLELACDAPGCAALVREPTAAAGRRLSHSLFHMLGSGWTVDSVGLSHAYCPVHRSHAQHSLEVTLLDFLLPLEG